ncbi:MAG: proton-conducting transporter membrane subunit [Chloroflexota bacterium]
MYPIIGIWGGANRIYATVKFVLYTLVGSLLMLIAILATAYTYFSSTGSWDNSFDVIALTKAAGTGMFGGTFGLLAFGAFFLARDQGPDVPIPYVASRRARRGAHGGLAILAGVLLKLGGYGFIRFAMPLYPEVANQLS